MPPSRHRTPASGNGSAIASPSTQVMRRSRTAAASLRIASSSIAAEKSRPTTSAAPASRNARARSPVPVATSRTRDSVRIAIAKRLSHRQSPPGDVPATGHQPVHQVIAWNDAIEHRPHISARSDRSLGRCGAWFSLHRMIPAPKVMANQRQSRAVPPSTGFNARPLTCQTRRTSRIARGAVVQASSGPGWDNRRHPDQDRHRVGHCDQCRVFPACGSRPDANGKRALSSHAIGVDVSQVVDDEDGRDQAAHRDRCEQCQSSDVMRHDKGRAYHGYRSEENEDEELAQSQVTKWLRARGIGDGSGDRQRDRALPGPAHRARRDRDREPPP